MDPVGTPAEQFMLMMHERIIALEAQGDVHRDQLARLTHVECGPKEYDVAEDKFTDGGGCVDWFIWEPVESIHVLNHVAAPTPLTAAHWDARVTLPNVSASGNGNVDADGTVELWLPVERYGDVYRMIRMPVRQSVREFFTAVHAFYDTAITREDLKEHDLAITHGVMYCRNALINLARGNRVTWSDLMGHRAAYWPSTSGGETHHRRGAYSCSGCVRYEGVRTKGRDLVLVLGS